MVISIKKWFTSGSAAEASGEQADIICKDFELAIADYGFRLLAFNTCVNLIANAIGKCEFKTFRGGKEIKEQEYYLWNYEPNTNQNSSAFLHKLIYKLYRDNEALIISTRRRDGKESLSVADSFTASPEYPAKMQEYSNVVVGDVSFARAFREKDVLHFKLNNKDINMLLAGISNAYNRLISITQTAVERGLGMRLKVHVDQIESKDPNFAAKFSDLMNNQVKKFIENPNAVLPEFDGYTYTEFAGSTNIVNYSREMKALADDIYSFTARAFAVPDVLLFGNVAGTADAFSRWMTTCIDPLCDQLQEEIVRKRYGYEDWVKGNYLHIDTTTIMHVDMFENADKIEKLIGSAVYSVNDVLEAMGRAPLPEKWADEHYLTLNISKVEDSVQNIAQMKGGES